MVLVLGIAYKKNVDDMRESPSVEIMQQLIEGEGDDARYVQDLALATSLRGEILVQLGRSAEAMEPLEMGRSLSQLWKNVFGLELKKKVLRQFKFNYNSNPGRVLYP